MTLTVSVGLALALVFAVIVWWDLRRKRGARGSADSGPSAAIPTAAIVERIASAPDEHLPTAGAVATAEPVGVEAGSSAIMPGAPAATDEPSLPTPRKQNFIFRHWNGEYSLKVSVLVFYFAISGPVGGLSRMLMWNMTEADSDPRLSLIVLGLMLGLFLIVGTWQIVGVWRAAERVRRLDHIGTGLRAWTFVVQLLMILTAGSAVWATQATVRSPLLGLWSIAFGGDPEIPDYAIRVMRGGTEAEIIGGLKVGLTEEFKTILIANPKIRVLHLDSAGGRLFPAIALGKIVRENNIQTYVSNRCFSACTLVFLAGQQRFLGPGGSLGFHAGANSFANGARFDDDPQKALLKAAGVPDKFIEAVLNTPPTAMWQPTLGELKSTGIVTDKVSLGRFALSGVGMTVTDDVVAAQFGGTPLFELVRAKNPPRFAEIVDLFRRAHAEGWTGDDVLTPLRAVLHAAFLDARALAGDAQMLAFARLSIKSYAELRRKDPQLCASYLRRSDPDHNYTEDIGADLIRQHDQVGYEMISTMTNRPAVGPADIRALWQKVAAVIDRAGEQSQDIFDIVNGTAAATPDRYCEAWITEIRGVMKLAPDEAATLLRNIAPKM